MHRIAATPGGWQPGQEGVIVVEQDPAPIVVLTAADTEIQTLAAALEQLPETFPAVRAVNLLNLQQQLTIDTYADDVLIGAEAIALRLLGGQAYWSYGLEVVKEVVAKTGAQLLVLPGDDRPDLDLMSHSTLGLSQVDRLWRYFVAGGVENICEGLKAIANLACQTNYDCRPPRSLANIGLYTPPPSALQPDRLPTPNPSFSQVPHSGGLRGPSAKPIANVGILLYRAHVLSANTAPIDALCEALQARGLQVTCLYTYSLKDPELPAQMLEQFRDRASIDVLIDTTSFSLAKLDSGDPAVAVWQALDVPVLQAILSGVTVEQWQESPQGLSPRDIAMNVALPEVDGRLISRAISFKAMEQKHERLQTEVVRYRPQGDRVEFVADLAANWARLRRTAVGDRRVALLLANYPNRDGRLANGVGLDTPESCVRILQAMQQAGYDLPEIPTDSAALMKLLTSSATNDPEGLQLRPVRQVLSAVAYRDWFDRLPAEAREKILQQWGEPDDRDIPIAGVQFGKIFVGIQPSRGFDIDPSLNYHSPDLVPPHRYLAFYAWLRSQFDTRAIVHIGKHGNLEWLPGKGIALSENCFPEVAFGPLPHLYPFIVNDPGEGAQAKRRAQAAIVDHLTPPLTRAELYGPLLELERLIDEYYEAQSLDPRRLPMIQPQILKLLEQENVLADIEVSGDRDVAEVLNRLDGYLCELKEAQIRDGLHILGQYPAGRQGIDLLVALARFPGAGQVGLTQAIARDCNLDFDPLTADPGQALRYLPEDLQLLLGRECRVVGDAIEAIELLASTWVAQPIAGKLFSPQPGPSAKTCLEWLRETLWPKLQQTPREIEMLLLGLAGRYVPSGPSGAPTRGRSDVLPTGRNFYSVDIRAIPTETAWAVGQKAADAAVERYVQEEGEYPKTLGLSVWGTSTMRTGGDDWAEALALMGVRPVWDGLSRRVVDFEILPVAALGRPRVDVTLRISGFFRDAFPNLISLFDAAVQAVARVPESSEENPIRDRIQTDTRYWQQQGLSADRAQERASYRIFGSKPGAYGAGLQGLIEAQNWSSDADLARAYLNWSGYAYTGQAVGHAAPEAFEQRLQQLQIVLHNQDNREHDLLDSDDYYQFQGGMVAAARSLTGQNPKAYFGDHSRPTLPKVRSLEQEIRRVYRSRVVNPKWIAGAMRHGYKGAFELAATLDYVFAYDATARCVPDFIYEGIARSYVLDEAVGKFVRGVNPWALRDMSERLLEAHQRGLWSGASKEMLEAIELEMLEAEGEIEQRD
ncbi:cobaltochelatase subunit CobN [Synechococcus sp. PCC 7336]|uniref:cobaltochelatase subunit CobN n=1 Tax=Synechococcus sp. PCC 7336 TaxID=195250 RepID=UPI0003483B16|nr:cobaltochelatase subunit CobN [Synechococcus sp. PCC 7336]